MAVFLMRIRTSLIPTSGTGTSSSHSPGCAYFLTRAFIVLPLLRIQMSADKVANVAKSVILGIILKRQMPTRLQPERLLVRRAQFRKNDRHGIGGDGTIVA